MAQYSASMAHCDPQLLVRLYAEGLTQAEIGRQVGLSQASVGEALRRQGVRARPRGHRVYHFDESFFADIATPEQAYWLGFLAADGFIIKTTTGLHTGVGVRLAAADRQHLEKLAVALNANTPDRRQLAHNLVTRV